MKAIVVSTLIFSSFVTFADESEKYVIKLDWQQRATLKDNITLQCDDTYYSGVELIVPGKAGSDFIVDMTVDITKGKIITGCKVSMENLDGSVKYKIDVDSSCTISVFQMKPSQGETPKTAVYELNDAC